MLANTTDPTLPLNRAAAYLKLFKYEDADRDCTKVLQLDAKNVKALWRRAQARREIGRLEDAEDDLRAASQIDPGNEAVRLDLEKVLAIKAKEKGKGKIAQGLPGNVGVPKRRRVPIEIVDNDDDIPPTSSKSTLPLKSVMKKDFEPPPTSKPKPVPGPVSRVVLSPTSDSAPTPTPTASFTAAKSARESARPSRVGGGIFRPNGAHTVVERPPVAIQRPKTLFALTRKWDSLGEGDEQGRWDLLRVSDIDILSCAKTEGSLRR